MICISYIVAYLHTKSVNITQVSDCYPLVSDRKLWHTN